ICKDVVNQCYQETKKIITLISKTLGQRINGGKSKAQYNAEKQLMEPNEEQQMVNFAVDQAPVGFPVNRAHIREHANNILEACLHQQN
ncbi:hypothetical protein C8J56DRAFT_800859, partial [Mycena floridula]